jgi:hypothetical protein
MYINEYNFLFSTGTIPGLVCIDQSHLLRSILDHCISINRFDKTYFCEVTNCGDSIIMFTVKIDISESSIILDAFSYRLSDGMRKQDFETKYLLVVTEIDHPAFSTKFLIRKK